MGVSDRDRGRATLSRVLSGVAASISRTAGLGAGDDECDVVRPAGHSPDRLVELVADVVSAFGVGELLRGVDGGTQSAGQTMPRTAVESGQERYETPLVESDSALRREGCQNRLLRSTSRGGSRESGLR